MSHALPQVWFWLVGVLLAGYVILDGFDFGVGILHLFARGDRERRALLGAIGPFWDGNEVWLITGGGALFAAFPEVYATAFSGFYLAFMLLLFALIARAVAIEFRSQRPDPRWRRTWDVAFSAGSVVAAILLGVALGDVAWGIPLGADHEFAGSFWGLLRPYALLTGLTSVALLAMHGGLYLCLRTEGELRERARGWVHNAALCFLIGYALTTAATLLRVPAMTEAFARHPALLVLPALPALGLVGVAWGLRHGRYGRAFLASAATIASLLATFGVGMYPNLIRSNPFAGHGLTIANAASSPRTLSIMLVIALVGMPLVLGYTAIAYRAFRGKVKLDVSGY
jgi:cytochrome bd ubiquinol oxidase subunit II